ncbi:hypothetical protein PHYSODRAFT_489649 [Phytophthora sojae]|uniref:Helicase-associated domain-containing protein n=1 Tax=Phytophthora sojae (strain P6497) TaxID=1094619 RepID=G4Z7W7_PHYSP|nr:hypothetical protein PHYSODRAFT_489649 [Phytophthora sojae]EGZ22502.1 hypothetical protein PHYSODRAFT_489649 [Phytophthora sojae]|eukprot:XP_009525219.1 hypothetical protein PHYSODRAFT_489649 [Phytophthora sojae]
MLSIRLTARRAWRLAQPVQAVSTSACSAARLRCLVAPRHFSSTLSDGSIDSSDAVKNGAELAKGYQGESAWEKKILTALRVYKQLHGDLLVSFSFTIPSGDERWPPVTWGYKLGAAVSNLRTKIENKGYLSAGMEEELDKLGFVRSTYQFKWDNIVLPALRQFRQVHGHADVPVWFVVPSGDEAWPELAWGYRLGRAVSKIRGEHHYSAQVDMSKEELDRMDFCYEKSISDRKWEEKILPSLQVYRQEFGDCIIPTAFTVPSCPPWPEKAWKMPLGIVVNCIRSRVAYAEQAARDKEVLDALGFAWSRDDAVVE